MWEHGNSFSPSKSLWEIPTFVHVPTYISSRVNPLLSSFGEKNCRFFCLHQKVTKVQARREINKVKCKANNRLILPMTEIVELKLRPPLFLFKAVLPLTGNLKIVLTGIYLLKSY